MSYTVLLVFSCLMSAGLFYFGYLFLTNQEKAFKTTGHISAELPKIFAGRYIGMGLLLVSLVMTANYMGLALAFALGFFLGVFDGVVTSRAGGQGLPHYAVAALSGIVAVICYFIGRQYVSS